MIVMELIKQAQQLMQDMVDRKLCSGMNLLVMHNGKEALYTQVGLSDIGANKPLQRDNIFRLFSQTKPITAAAVMLLAERGVIDLRDGVEKYLPGFRDPKIIESDGTIHPASRTPNLRDLLNMCGGLAYADDDPSGLLVKGVFEKANEAIRAGGGIPTVELMNMMGQQPMAAEPGTVWRYSICADVLAAVVEVATGKRFGDFLMDEFFIPLDMKDTAFYVPEEKQDRFVKAYSCSPDGLQEWNSLHMGIGEYSREPAYQAGGAGLVSTIDDYSHFLEMMLNGGRYNGKYILSPETVRYLTTNHLTEQEKTGLWPHMWGHGFGCLSRVCVDPAQYPGLAKEGEFGWGGMLGTDFYCFPKENFSMLVMYNTIWCCAHEAVGKLRNLLLAALSRGDL